MAESLKNKTVAAFFWSAIQSWGIKIFALVLFLLLAKFLSPAELGVASAVILVLSFIAIVSEQGFIDAIVQNKRLQPVDLNIPFVISISIALLSSGALFLFSDQIAHFIDAEGAGPLIKISSVIPPLVATSNFQIAIARRNLNFKRLASATISATLISGIIALAMAMTGYGALSLVVQAIITALLTAAFMWIKPLWKVKFGWSLANFKGIFSYSVHTFSSKVLDFFSGKIIDLIILTKFGVVGLGIYTVGSKLYLTLLQLLSSSLVDVALSAMSKISSNKEKISLNYLKFIYLSSCITFPLFVSVGLLSDEICALLFAQKWTGVADIAKLLSFLGAVQVVQFFNTATFGSMGKANYIFLLNLLKFTSGVISLTVFSFESILELVLYYVVSQVFVSPISFFLAIKLTGVSFKDVFKNLYAGILCSLIASFFVVFFRNYLNSESSFILLIELSVVFLFSYVFFLMVLENKKFITEIKYILKSR